jgi:sterol desaturase/sphingolipid hydroxylase (fatty acid hydroxylase superfamily)
MPEFDKRGSVPIRLFKSDFLESFSHVTPLTVLVLWSPVTLYFLVHSIWFASGGAGAARVVFGLFVGWFLWTFAEYIMHRFLFHYHPKTERFKKLFFHIHGVHHAQPLCKTRLVMPPAMSIPLALLYFGFFHLVVDTLIGRPAWFSPLYAGFLVGYICYDMMHYTLHHSRSKNQYIQMCRYQHMQHHGTCPNMRFGVSSPFWDLVFGTMPRVIKKQGS